MTARTITVTIPELLYRQLETAARVSAQSVDAVVAQTLERAMPARLAAVLPVALRSELAAMEQLSDDALLAIATHTAPPTRGARMDALLDAQEATALAPDQQAELQALRAEANALVVRKAHALVLLQRRGLRLPSVDQLPVPAG